MIISWSKFEIAQKKVMLIRIDFLSMWIVDLTIMSCSLQIKRKHNERKHLFIICLSSEIMKQEKYAIKHHNVGVLFQLKYMYNVLNISFILLCFTQNIQYTLGLVRYQKYQIWFVLWVDVINIYISYNFLKFHMIWWWFSSGSKLLKISALLHWFCSKNTKENFQNFKMPFSILWKHF